MASFVPTIEELTEDEPEVVTSLQAAEQLKKEGNDLFKDGEYERALEKYTAALSACHPSCHAERSVFHCNSAACHVKLGNFRAGKAQCDEALSLNGDYVKALMRRILCLERLDEEKADASEDPRLRASRAADASTSRASPVDEEREDAPPSEAKPEGSDPALAKPAAPGRGGDDDHLQRALEDCDKWLALEPGAADAVRKRAELETRIKERQEKLKEEVVGKLKDLGNNILGRFGLSLDNFKAEKDPNTGSYSINFKK